LIVAVAIYYELAKPNVLPPLSRGHKKKRIRKTKTPLFSYTSKPLTESNNEGV